MSELPKEQPENRPKTPQLQKSEVLFGLACAVLAGGVAAGFRRYSEHRSATLGELQNPGLPWWKRELMAVRTANKKDLLNHSARGMLVTMGQIMHRRLR